MTTEASEQTITITVKRFKDLEMSEAKLTALENGGVDNWAWYSESLKDFYKEYYGDEDEE